ncbi:MAG TPA: nuclear transport factor 2 family protein [Pseudonocardia sp.]|jgi:ketosteroid isomerase-like protein
MLRRGGVAELFGALDRGDLEIVTGFFRDDVVIVFGNATPVRGTAAFTELYAQVLGSLRGIRHDIHQVWRPVEDRDVLVVVMTVHYSRLDGAVVSVPCCNVLRLREGFVADYRVYLDAGPVFAPYEGSAAQIAPEII